MEEDINTMHRYRDALVVEQDGPFERTAYGAYVLFPWNQEEAYENHPFYKSIEKVNIGGFPFLPNATRLVEQFLDHLIEKPRRNYKRRHPSKRHKRRMAFITRRKSISGQREN